MLVMVDAKLPFAEEAFNPFGDVRVIPTKEMTNAAIRHADAILIRSETEVNGSLLEGTHVRFVGTATIGTDHVDTAYLHKRGIGFASCPGSNADSVAEYILGALLEVGARLGFPLRGRTLGVVGHGNTGSRVAKKAIAIGMRVLVNDPPLARATGDAGYVPLQSLMDADIISLHVPLTRTGEDATFHLFDEQRLRAMKPGSILINASRGAVVETAPLKHALRTEHLRACVLDVWENEPGIDIDLLRRVMLGTPHIAGYSFDGKVNATKMLRTAMSAFFRVDLPPLDIEGAEPVKVTLPDDASSPEALMRSAVRASYNIGRDDAHLRQIIALQEHLRADFFRELRAAYPVRREFHNFVIEDGRLPAEVSGVLSSVGFHTHSHVEAL